MNIETILTNPELASKIRIEISGSDLLELSATLIKVSKEQERMSEKETYLTKEEVSKIIRRSDITLVRYKKNKSLVPNQLGLYKRSEVDKFMEKR